MDVTYATVKICVTECNDVMKRHSHLNMVDVSNRSDCIIKNLRSEMEGVQEKESIMGVSGRW